MVGEPLVARRIGKTVKSGIDVPHYLLHIEDGVVLKDAAAVDFASEMSHEIRTPLNVIIGLCQYLERDRKHPLSKEQRDSVVRMERNAQALLKSVSRLLDKVRTGKI